MVCNNGCNCPTDDNTRVSDPRCRKDNKLTSSAKLRKRISRKAILLQHLIWGFKVYTVYRQPLSFCHVVEAAGALCAQLTLTMTAAPSTPGCTCQDSTHLNRMIDVEIKKLSREVHDLAWSVPATIAEIAITSGPWHA